MRQAFKGEGELEGKLQTAKFSPRCSFQTVERSKKVAETRQKRDLQKLFTNGLITIVHLVHRSFKMCVRRTISLDKGMFTVISFYCFTLGVLLA